MEHGHILTLITIIFAITGLVFLSSFTQPEQLITNNAIVGFAVANPNQESGNGVFTSINSFFANSRLPPSLREKYLPIYILLNIIFVVSIVTAYHHNIKR